MVALPRRARACLHRQDPIIRASDHPTIRAFIRTPTKPWIEYTRHTRAANSHAIEMDTINTTTTEPPSTIPVLVQGNSAFSQSDVDTIAAIPNVTDVSIAASDPTQKTLSCSVPYDTGLAKTAVNEIARLHPNTPVRWSTPKAV